MPLATMHNAGQSEGRSTAREIRIPYHILISGIAGAGLMYFLDPQVGKRRRTTLRDRTGGMIRHTSRRVASVGRRTSATVYGLRQKMTHRRPEEISFPNNPDLVARVESERFRDPDIPKGSININAEYDGKIVVRGQVEDAGQIKAIERAIKQVRGVWEVENLLHLPGTPAPNKQAARAAGHESITPQQGNNNYEIVHH